MIWMSTSPKKNFQINDKLIKKLLSITNYLKAQK